MYKVHLNSSDTNTKSERAKKKHSIGFAAREKDSMHKYHQDSSDLHQVCADSSATMNCNRCNGELVCADSSATMNCNRCNGELVSCILYRSISQYSDHQKTMKNVYSM